jgi:hypothetical protein
MSADEIGRAGVAGNRNAYTGFWWQKSEGETSLKTLAYMDNIKVDLNETGGEAMDWFCMAEDKHQWRALVNIVTHLYIL